MAVKRIAVIGLGTFGRTLAERLDQLGLEVVAVDLKSDVVDAIGSKVARAVVGDCTRRPVLQEAGAADVEAAVISMGEDLAASVLALLALHDLGVKRIFVKVGSDEHARIVDALGAEESVFPERESALALASRLAAGSLLRYVELGPRLHLQEMPVPTAWAGRTLRELALPRTHGVQVVAIHDVLKETMVLAVDPERRLVPSDALLVAGDPEALHKLARLS